MNERNVGKTSIKDTTCMRLYCLHHALNSTNYQWKICDKVKAGL